MSELFAKGVLHGLIGPGAIILNDYVLTVSDIDGGHRLTIARGNDVQTLDVMDGKDGGVTSWNDLQDRPFYEETIYSDTISWEFSGNPSDYDTVCEALGLVWISDATPTAAELATGTEYRTRYSDDLTEPHSMSGATDLGIIAVNTNLEAGDPPTVVVAYADNVEFEGAVFPKKGLYVCVQLYWFTSSITIPGYRFEVGKTVKQLDPKFIPASVKLPAVTTEDAGKFLRVSADGAWAAETATSEEWTFTLEDDSTVTKKVVVIE